VRPGEEEEFVAAWEDFVRWASGFAGSGTFRLVRDANAPGEYFSFARWEDGDAQRAWVEDGEFGDRLGRVREHCDDFHSSMFELVSQVP
jgi:heme-degrading monooxygenase HmoA